MKDNLPRSERPLSLPEVTMPDFPLVRYIILAITALLLIALGWIIGLSTPLPEILEAAGAQEQTRLLTLAMVAGTSVALVILLIWGYTASQHWQTNQALKKSKERYRRLVDVSPDGIIVHNENEIIWANPAVANIIGMESPDELIGASIGEFLPIEHREVILRRIRQALHSRDPLPLSHERFIMTDGTTVDAALKSAPLVYEGQRAMLTIIRDITERKRLEREAAERRSYLEELLQSTIDAIVTLDEERRILEWNPGAENLFGYSAEEAIGRDIDKLIAKPDDQMMEEAVNYTKRTLSGSPIPPTETIRYRKDGEPVHVILTGAPIQIEGELVGVVATYTNITARRQAQEELSRLVAAVQTSIDSIVICDMEGKIIYANPAVCRLHRLDSADEMIGGNVFEWFAPEERDRALTAMHETLEKGSIREQAFTTITKDGECIPIEINATLLRDEEGQPTGFAAVTRDISERKQVEDELLQYAAELEDRNEELDAFAQTVAHDLKNPLAYIVGYSDIVKTKSATLPNDELEHYLDIIARNGRLASDIVDDLLLLASARRMDVELEPLDMGDIVEEALDRLYWEIEESQAKIIKPESSAWPTAVGAPSWIEEVWVNYISNSIKYGGRLEKGIPPRIELGFDELAASTAGESASSHVRFWVRDNGLGLKPEEQERLFVPFTRLNHAGIKGHGLGLSIVRRIVEKLGGKVGVESEVGNGSTFYFTLCTQVKVSEEGAQ